MVPFAVQRACASLVQISSSVRGQLVKERVADTRRAIGRLSLGGRALIEIAQREVELIVLSGEGSASVRKALNKKIDKGSCSC
jgi:hypothetical protein